MTVIVNVGQENIAIVDAKRNVVNVGSVVQQGQRVQQDQLD